MGRLTVTIEESFYVHERERERERGGSLSHFGLKRVILTQTSNVACVVIVHDSLVCIIMTKLGYVCTSLGL